MGFSALQANKKAKAKKADQQKSNKVLGGKLQKESALGTTLRNQLDSSAPARRRGKEREGGKKKRKTLMKKIILADREKRREARLRSGETLKPLPLPPDEDILPAETSDLKS